MRLREDCEHNIKNANETFTAAALNNLIRVKNVPFQRAGRLKNFKCELKGSASEPFRHCYGIRLTAFLWGRLPIHRLDKTTLAYNETL